ncbi:MAG: hypothetical protein AAGF24_01950 [Cyanobacteria bacterium P01_H01_bin.121]
MGPLQPQPVHVRGSTEETGDRAANPTNPASTTTVEATVVSSEVERVPGWSELYDLGPFIDVTVDALMALDWLVLKRACFWNAAKHLEYVQPPRWAYFVENDTLRLALERLTLASVPNPDQIKAAIATLEPSEIWWWCLQRLSSQAIIQLYQRACYRASIDQPFEFQFLSSEEVLYRYFQPESSLGMGNRDTTRDSTAV